MPRMTSFSPAERAAAAASGLIGMFRPPSSAPLSLSGTLTRFIAGEPMKPATKALPGLSYRLRGVSTCCRMPSLSSATRSPIVIASTWSCVT